MRRVFLNPTDEAHHYPSVNSLAGAPLKLWQDTYKVAETFYAKSNLEGGPGPAATSTAWKAVLSRYTPRYGGLMGGVQGWDKAKFGSFFDLDTKKFRPAKAFPELRVGDAKRFVPPKSVIILGRLIEHVSIPAPPEIVVRRFEDDEDAPFVYWSREQLMLFVLPNLDVPESRTPISRNEKVYQEFKSWTEHDPRGAVRVKASAYPLVTKGQMDTITYRSSKWTAVRNDPVEAKLFIHSLGTNDVLQESKGGKPPSCIVIRGGNLDVTPAGIIN